MKRKNIKKITLFSTLLTFAFVATSKVFATEITWPSSPMGTSLLDYKTTTLSSLVQYFYEWGISIGALFAFISIVVAGFQYLTSVGDPGKIAKAMERIKASFLGLALLLGTFLILNTINPELTTLDVNSNILDGDGLEELSFVEYELSTECAYAKIYANTADMKADFKEDIKYEKEGGKGQTVLVGYGYTKAAITSPFADNTVYTVAKFFSIPKLVKVTKKYSINDVNADPFEIEKDYGDGSTLEYPDGYKKLLIDGPNGEKYIESTGTECMLLFYNEANCFSLGGSIFGISNITYPSNNLSQSSTANPNDVRCYFLKDNN